MATKRPTPQQEDAERAETVGETASEADEMETEEHDAATTSEEEFEVRIVQRGTPAAAAAAALAASLSASEDDAGSSAAETENAPRDENKCALCSGRKVKACSNLACKRCCVRMDQACAVHSKAVESKPKIKVAAESGPVDAIVQPLRKARKPVFKHEFKESSVLYYGETVTLFCVRDFFHAKKLSQPLLNDQTRRLRAAAAAAPMTEEEQQKKKKRVRAEGGLEAKARVLDALGGDAKRRNVVSPAH